MFFLSICLGSLFLVMLHHLFDASWSIGLRRFLEHLACLLPIMGFLFIPIAIFAPQIYPWMRLIREGHPDHALLSKQPLLTYAGYYAASIGCFVIWWVLSRNLRAWSLRQDVSGSAECTYRMRFHSYWGIFAFAITLSLAVILWVKSIEHEWFSTMYGVYYFAESVWTTLATAYVIMVLLKRQGLLREVIGEEQAYFLGSVLFAFTVFYAYIHFAQYFIIWNANMPEETFWYVLREKGSWWDIGLVIVFGHFLIPFLALLRIDAKLSLPVMIPLAIWAWIMHFCDVSFNVMPMLHPNGFVLHWLDLACLAVIGGVLVEVFLRYVAAHPAYPLKDPRYAELMKVYIEPISAPTEPTPAGKPAK